MVRLARQPLLQLQNLLVVLDGGGELGASVRDVAARTAGAVEDVAPG